MATQKTMSGTYGQSWSTTKVDGDVDHAYQIELKIELETFIVFSKGIRL